MRGTVRGVLLDLDGTLYVAGAAVAGAPGAVEALRAAGVGVRFVTNTTRHPRRAVLAELERLGFAARLEEVLTAPVAAAEWLAVRGIRRLALCLPDATREDFAGFTIDEHRPEAVVVGDLGHEWTFDRLNQAFRWLLEGAVLVALQKSRYWQAEHGLELDVGPFVAALEYAAGKEAVLVGKPSREFFLAAVRGTGLPPAEVAMVGDDVLADVAGAQAVGCLGILVRTGKYRPEDERRADVTPDVVLDSVAALPPRVAGARG